MNMYGVSMISFRWMTKKMLNYLFGLIFGLLLILMLIVAHLTIATKHSVDFLSSNIDNFIDVMQSPPLYYHYPLEDE